MTIEVSADPRRAAGYAFVDVSAALPAPPITLQFEREHPSKPFLGSNGWQAEREEITPRHAKATDTGVRFLVGPEVVNFILDYEQVTISIPSIGLRREIVWPSIPPLRGASSNLQPIDQPISARLLPTQHEAASSPPDEPAAATPVQTNEHSGLPVGAVADRASRTGLGAGSLAAIALVLVLVAAAAFAYFAWLQAETELVAGTTETRERTGAGQGADAGAGDGVPPGRASPTPTPSPGEAQDAGSPDGEPARDHRALILDQTTTPEQLMLLGLELVERQPPDFDLAFEAITRAAERGHAPASRWIAEAYDPRFETWRQVFGDKPSALSALRHYADAASANEGDAAAEVSALCAWLRPRQPNGTNDERLAFETSCEN